MFNRLSLEGNQPFGHRPQHQRVELVFQPQNTPGQTVRCIISMDSLLALRVDRAIIHPGHDEMHAASMHRIPGINRFLVSIQPFMER